MRKTVRCLWQAATYAAHTQCAHAIHGCQHSLLHANCTRFASMPRVVCTLHARVAHLLHGCCAPLRRCDLHKCRQALAASCCRRVDARCGFKSGRCAKPKVCSLNPYTPKPYMPNLDMPIRYMPERLHARTCLLKSDMPEPCTPRHYTEPLLAQSNTLHPAYRILHAGMCMLNHPH